jgi:hypothetical protein
MYRNQRILDLPKHGDIPCQYCQRQDGTIVAAHSNHQIHGKGLGLKAHDCFVGYLCFACHNYVDQGKDNEALRNYVWRTAHDNSIPLFRHLLGALGEQLLREDLPA